MVVFIFVVFVVVISLVVVIVVVNVIIIIYSSLEKDEMTWTSPNGGVGGTDKQTDTDRHSNL